MNTNNLIASLLSAPKDGEDQSFADTNKAIRDAFFRLGSETEDNTNCMNLIEYGSVDEIDIQRRTLGLRLKNTDIVLSSIAHALEDLPVPEHIKEDFPEISDEQWLAAARMMTMIMISLEYRQRLTDS